jgi:hypothetical protein
VVVVFSTRGQKKKRKKVQRSGLTTHLVLASVLALGTPDAQRRRGFGTDCVDSFKAWMRNVNRRSGLPIGRPWPNILVLGNCQARSARKGIANRHRGCACWLSCRGCGSFASVNDVVGCLGIAKRGQQRQRKGVKSWRCARTLQNKIEERNNCWG